MNDNLPNLTLAANPENMGRLPRDPRRALRAFRRLAQNKDDTHQVFQILHALSGNAIANGYQRLLRTAEGGRQAYTALELADRLNDCEWLARFPQGSVGASYREFIALRDFSAYGLAEESRKLDEADLDAAHPIAWYARRIRDVHDIWHVLTGYGADALGEACVVAFTYAQTGNLGLGFLGVAAAIELKRKYRSAPFLKAVFQAWRNGRNAAWLPALDYERLFSVPLADARLEFSIAQPSVYDGVPREARNAYQYPPDPALPAGWPSEAL